MKAIMLNVKWHQHQAWQYAATVIIGDTPSPHACAMACAHIIVIIKCLLRLALCESNHARYVIKLNIKHNISLNDENERAAWLY